VISLSVTLTILPDQVERFLEVFAPVVRGALNDEEGCLYYELSRSAGDNNVFHVYEVYRDDASLDAHRRSAHFTAWSAVADDVLAPGGRTARLGVIISGSSLSGLGKEK
jgi:(4S)-4-hydroxy-5-phosphonooxypentane-2,3-dione isomerase